VKPSWQGLLRLSLVSCPVALSNVVSPRAEVRFMVAFPPLANIPDSDDDMVTIAKRILEQKLAPFDPRRFEDRYDGALRDLIDEKRRGGVTVRPQTAPPAPMLDLMEALRASSEPPKPANDSSKPRILFRRNTQFDRQKRNYDRNVSVTETFMRCVPRSPGGGSSCSALTRTRLCDFPLGAGHQDWRHKVGSSDQSCVCEGVNDTNFSLQRCLKACAGHFGGIRFTLRMPHFCIHPRLGAKPHAAVKKKGSPPITPTSISRPVQRGISSTAASRSACPSASFGRMFSVPPGNGAMDTPD